MKKILSLLLILSLLCCFGCSNDVSETGVPFYYAVASPDYSSSAPIGKEYRQDLPTGTLTEMLTFYLTGPENSHLVSPFPADLEIVEARQDEKTVYLTVSMELTGLTGLDLTLACSCLTLTCLALTNAETVQITPNYGLLDGQKSITMDKNTILLYDSSRN